MTSGSKMVLFFLCATVFNLAVMLVLVVIFGAIAALAHNIPWLSGIIIVVGLIGSIVLTFMIYTWVMKKVSVRLQLEKHIPQLFKGKKRG